MFRNMVQEQNEYIWCQNIWWQLIHRYLLPECDAGDKSHPRVSFFMTASMCRNIFSRNIFKSSNKGVAPCSRPKYTMWAQGRWCLHVQSNMSRESGKKLFWIETIVVPSANPVDISAMDHWSCRVNVFCVQHPLLWVASALCAAWKWHQQL